MSVVVTLCDFFLQYFQIDGSYLFRPKSHQKCREKLHPKKFGNIFHATFRCPENVSGSGERKKNIRGGLKREILNFRTEAPIFNFFPTAKKFLGRNL